MTRQQVSFSEDVLKVLSDFSESMLIEWVDDPNSCGFDKIDAAIDTKLLPVLNKEKLSCIKANVRSFFIMDMAIIGCTTNRPSRRN